MTKKDMCQRCEQRPGHLWDGSGGFTQLCGPCKLRVVLDVKGQRLATRLSAEATLATGQPIKVQFDVSNDDDNNTN